MNFLFGFYVGGFVVTALGQVALALLGRPPDPTMAVLSSLAWPFSVVRGLLNLSRPDVAIAVDAILDETETTTAPNRWGCRPSEDVCLEHGEPLVCHHGCPLAEPHSCDADE